ncbi:MAG: ATPase, T2SS/T4P/T4SS family [Candidatus Altiarchaeota archaeon]|nr:ATPase, T2SS/T4P/T4SS family [Candidatus Altiarchaeota archaeon]
METFKIKKIELNEKEKRTIMAMENKFLMTNMSELAKMGRKERYQMAKEFIEEEIEKKDISESDINLKKSIEYLSGYGVMDPILDRDDIEEVLINGHKSPVMIVHRQFGKCYTNVEFTSKEDLMALINKIIIFCGAKKGSAIIDEILPEGPRINLTLPPVSFNKPLLTIRKYLRELPTVVDLIRNGTLPIDMTALLWICVDGFNLAPRNMLITGGTSSGKTTLLNSLLPFSRERERIVSIEDTLEIDLHYCKDWCRTATTEFADMEKLVENSLRLRPDRVIVGEVRGSEAFNLINAMNLGHTGMGTIHADNARDALLKLSAPPMNVNPEMLVILDLIVVVNRVHEKSSDVRKMTHIAEVGDIVEGRLQLGSVCEYNPKLKKTEFHRFPAVTITKISEAVGLEPKEIINEIRKREGILEYMLLSDISTEDEVLNMIRTYYKKPDKTWNKVLSGLKRMSKKHKMIKEYATANKKEE